MDLQERILSWTHESNQPATLCISLSHTYSWLTFSSVLYTNIWKFLNGRVVCVPVFNICFRQPYSTVHWKLVLCFTCSWFTGCESLSLDLWPSLLSWCYQELYHHHWLWPFVPGLDIWFCASGPAHQFFCHIPFKHPANSFLSCYFPWQINNSKYDIKYGVYLVWIVFYQDVLQL